MCDMTGEGGLTELRRGVLGPCVLALLELLIGDAGVLHLDFEDEIVSGACIVRAGEIVHAGAKSALETAA